jgi:hypothetical protein
VAIDFGTWRTLSEADLDDAAAARLAARMVRAAVAEDAGRAEDRASGPC